MSSGHCLVAGGAGFIGSHLVDALVARGDRVTVVDNLVTGSRSNLAHLADHPAVRVIECDLTRPLPAQVVGEEYDMIFDLACPCAPVDYQRMPLDILQVASEGTRNLLDIAAARRARFVLASTSEVYGDPLVDPQPESNLGNVSTIDPRSTWFQARRFSEALTMAYHRTGRAEVRIARIFSTYGPRMRLDDGRAFTSFVTQALSSESLKVFGRGDQRRSFTYVGDVVEGVLRIAAGTTFGPFNLGCVRASDASTLASLVRDAIDPSAPIINVDPPAERVGEASARVAELGCLQSHIGWIPPTRLEDGVLLSTPWYVRAGEIPTIGIHLPTSNQ
jgi:dTDP-glucose 4,6-dehydratase